MINRLLTFYTRYFAVWVVLFGVVAWFVPGPFIFLKPGMNWLFALTMFGIGVALDLEDFKRIIRNPWIVAVGSAAQFVIMPFGAFVVARLMGLPDELAVGLILTGSAPGAMASNVMSYIAKADTAYSVSLTTVSTLLCPVLTPGLTLLLAGAKLDVSFLAMFYSVVQTVALPLALGFLIKMKFHKRIIPILPVFPAVSATFIIFICSMVIALNRDYLASVTGIVLSVCLILNLYGMAMGYGVGALFRMETRRRRTLSIEIGMQNAGLGVALALAHIGERAAVPAALFVFICIITASIMAALWQRRDIAKPLAIE